MSWNYRVGKKKHTEAGEEVVLHHIVECYYHEDGQPAGYVIVNALDSWEELGDLFGTYKLIGPAFEKPVIDLDNFLEYGWHPSVPE